MTTVAAEQLADAIENLNETAEATLAGESAEQFADFERYVNEVDTFARELQQSMWASDARATIRRLESGEPLGETDREVIRAFLISDADSYLKHENNVPDWCHELKRLMKELVRRVNLVDRQTIGDFRGVLKDAARLVPDLRNYFEERERITKFEHAMQSLDTPSRAMLARLMKEQLASPRR